MLSAYIAGQVAVRVGNACRPCSAGALPSTLSSRVNLPVDAFARNKAKASEALAISHLMANENLEIKVCILSSVSNGQS